MEIYNISEICVFEKKTGKKASEGKDSGKFKFFSSSQIQNKFSDTFNFEGEYLIIGTGGKANLHFCAEKFSASTDCLVLTSNNKLILTKYIYYFFIKNFDRLEDGFRGAGLRHISKEYIMKLKILVPNIATQEKIILMMDKAEELKRIRQEANNNVKSTLTSLFFGLFGNPFLNEKGFKKVKLSEICEISPKRLEIRNFPENTKVSFLEMASVSNKGEIINKVEKNLKEVIKGFTYFIDGDVLFAKITPCMENGKGAIAEGLVNGIGFGSTEFHILRPKKEILKEWLFSLINLKMFREYCKENMTGTAGQKRVSKIFLENIEVYLPPIKLQEKFLEIFNKIKILEDNQRKSSLEINKIYNNLVEKSIPVT